MNFMNNNNNQRKKNIYKFTKIKNIEPPQQNNNNNFIDNNMGMQNNQNNPNMKQVFTNNEITLFSAIDKNSENMSGSFYVTNNISDSLNNVKINFMVPKYLTLKVLNTTGSSLDANQSLGIKKVN